MWPGYIALATNEPPPASLRRGGTRRHRRQPAFVVEMVRLLTAGDSLEITADGLRVIPLSVKEVIGRGSAGSRTIAVDYSRSPPCWDASSNSVVLARASELPRDVLLALLDEALVDRLITDVPGTAARLRFSHALVRDALYERLPLGQRMQLHRKVGEALVLQHQANLEPHLTELAHHFFAAAPSGTADKAIEYTCRAGERAGGLLAYEEAARLFVMALTLAEDPEERCELLLVLGEAQARSGDTPASKRSYREAAVLAQAGGLNELLARADSVTEAGSSMALRGTTSTHCRFSRRLSRRSATRRAPCAFSSSRGWRGVPLRDLKFPPERKIALSKGALELARRIGDPTAVAYALDAYIPANESPENTRELLDLSNELLQLATDIGDKERALDAHEHRSNRLLELGQAAEAHAAVEAMDALAEEVRQPVYRWFVEVHRARLALLEGRLSDAEDLINAARSVGERAEAWYTAVAFGLQLYMLRWQQGRLAEVEELARRLVDDYPTYQVWRCVLAHMEVTLGREAAARGRWPPSRKASSEISRSMTNGCSAWVS